MAVVPGKDFPVGAFNNTDYVKKLNVKTAKNVITYVDAQRAAGFSVNIDTAHYNDIKFLSNVKTTFDKPPGSNGSGGAGGGNGKPPHPQKKPAQPGANYQWNLPPHSWSLPVMPQTVGNFTGSSDQGGSTGKPVVSPRTPDEKNRLGRMWFWSNSGYSYTDTSSTTASQSGGIASKSREFGFQFMWNPDSYSIGVSLNTDITPSAQDRFASAAGAFPSGETLNFTLRLDRTNDFACLRNLLNTTDLSKISGSTITPVPPAAGSVATIPPEIFNYYKTGNGKLGDSLAPKIVDLIKYGTVSDLEYIYKAVNGDGWSNVAGRKTSDIGYLQASLLRVDIGPMSFVGYILSLNVNHTAFSPDMTPIRTDVTISMNLMASAALAANSSTDSKTQFGAGL